MPIRIRIDGAEFDDDRSPETVAKFFDEKLGTRSHNAETEPFTAEQVTELFLSRLVIDYDCVFCHTITASRSLIHANAKQASLAILNRYHPIRKAAGVTPEIRAACPRVPGLCCFSLARTSFDSPPTAS